MGNVLAHYLDTTPQRTKLLDAFMAFLVAVGALQFAYCVLAGNYVRFLPLTHPMAFCISTVVLREVWTDIVLLGTAVQCVLVGFLCDCWAVCSYR